MNLRLWVVVLVCGGVGYWIVSALLSRAPTAKRGPSTAAPPSGPAPQDRRAGRDDADPSPPVADAADVTLMNWYKILGVPENATKDPIVAAYKRRISEYHPDKVAQMGQEIRELAERKSKQINAAYELGMRRYR
jgi:DnaJ like chaperone protein